MYRLDRLIRFLDHRSVWQLVAGYAIAAWVVLQVTDTLASLIGLPLWFGKAVLGLLAAGFVVVLMTGLLHGRLGAGGGSPAGGRLGRAFTWRHAAEAGFVGFALLGLGTTGYMAARAFGIGPAGTLLARGVLSADGELVLADFEDHAGDAGLAGAITQAFRVHVSQSPALKLVSGARVAEVLDRMQVSRGSALNLERAREVAIREGLKGVVAGEIHAVGSRYTVSARLVAAESGEELAAALESAGAPDELIPAVERLSVRLRERVGESLASLRRSPPLSRVRTASLSALRNYTEGGDANSRGEFERCALLMEQAIELDTLFAMAYTGRAACNQNLARNMALQVSDRIRAFAMRDRMTDEERLRFTAVYYQFVTRKREQAVQAWEAYAARYPDRTSALFSLANLYAEGRDWARAETTLQRGLELDPTSAIVLINLAGYQINQGRLVDADATFDRLEREVPGIDAGWWRATRWLAAADWDAAGAELAGARERVRGNVGQRARIAALQSRLSQTLGKIEAAERYAREAMAAELEVGSIELYHLFAIALASLQLEARSDTAAALATVEDALAVHPLESLDPFARRYLEFAEIAARSGQVARARTWVARWDGDVAPLVPGSVVPHWLRAVLAEAEGRHDDAIAEWRLEDGEREDPLPALVRIGRNHDRLGRADSAIAYYGRYLSTPSRLRYATDPEWRARVLERLGQLHEARGDTTSAAANYARFIELWSGADPSLGPAVEAVRTRLAALVARG